MVLAVQGVDYYSKKIYRAAPLGLGEVHQRKYDSDERQFSDETAPENVTKIVLFVTDTFLL